MRRFGDHDAVFFLHALEGLLLAETGHVDRGVGGARSAMTRAELCLTRRLGGGEQRNARSDLVSNSYGAASLLLHAVLASRVLVTTGRQQVVGGCGIVVASRLERLHGAGRVEAEVLELAQNLFVHLGVAVTRTQRNRLQVLDLGQPLVGLHLLEVRSRRRIEREHAPDQVLALGRHVSGESIVAGENAGEQRLVVVTVERKRTADQHIKNYAKTPHIDLGTTILLLA
mmetsp:Transcript_183/g.551  ORF Transcript_183/g.551 Transcript_183/m.551 type:complete len:228 (+) Transcript_183:349-1032(+)